MTKGPKQTSFMQLAREEPFRIFFPLGILMGVIGVGLWPLYLRGYIEVYPSVSHARLMIEGFLGAFIFGFLGTASPRMLGAPPLTGLEIAVFLLLYLLSGAFQLANLPIPGDGIFFLLLILFLGAFISRFRKRKDTPPPGFVLVACGYFCALAGVGMHFSSHFAALPGFTYPLADLFLNEGFALCPILGIGPFIFPRIGGLPNPHDFPESRSLPQGWGRKALFAGFTALGLLVSYFLEACGWVRLGNGLRFAFAFLYILREMPFRFPRKTSGTLTVLIRVGVACIALGLLTESILPPYRIALDHLFFIGGFSLLTLTVATRVILGHSGEGKRLQGRFYVGWILLFCILLSVGSRISSDFLPEIRNTHLLYGAAAWIFGVLAWAAAILPKVRIRGPD